MMLSRKVCVHNRVVMLFCPGQYGPGHFNFSEDEES